MARELVPGDLVLLKIGDVVPADGVLAEGGTMDIDQSGLTGESLPVKKSPGNQPILSFFLDWFVCIGVFSFFFPQPCKVTRSIPELLSSVVSKISL